MGEEKRSRRSGGTCARRGPAQAPGWLWAPQVEYWGALRVGGRDGDSVPTAVSARGRFRTQECQSGAMNDKRGVDLPGQRLKAEVGTGVREKDLTTPRGSQDQTELTRKLSAHRQEAPSQQSPMHGFVPIVPLL